ncbi:hypothetical protein [Nakamurella multipartita]|uniref:Uncharacterized protein n=1 Tax=Nakamurella multipartita (strain ATCC 700099 / DSM 44233 / CIP 104796 / JCM 9543 / NBRC 105858 / Y-104) TaxID=479431 RepID=C8X855_NAKMY|nr:hypothetical protein [Nakamurella multipartita]ACV77031.1 hypothetical protein Namu_0616 [Nakamurella multipartita DSM 44233]
MLQLRIYVPSALADPVLQALDADPGVSALAIVRDASIRPPGHLIMGLRT